MLGSSGDDINSGGVNAAVAQDIRQLSDILLNAVKRPGEQLA